MVGRGVGRRAVSQREAWREVRSELWCRRSEKCRWGMRGTHLKSVAKKPPILLSVPAPAMAPSAWASVRISAALKPELAVVVLLAVDWDGVAVEGLAVEAVRRDDLARCRLRGERVAQRRQREVDLLLAVHLGALDGPHGGGDGPARGEDFEDLDAALVGDRHGDAVEDEGRRAGQEEHPAVAGVHDGGGGHVGRELGADDVA